MMVQALMLLPRLVVTPPARLVVVPPHRCSTLHRTRRATWRGWQAEQLLGATGTAAVRGGRVLMCSTTRDPDRKVVLAAMEQRADALQYASAELKADREVVLAAPAVWICA